MRVHVADRRLHGHAVADRRQHLEPEHDRASPASRAGRPGRRDAPATGRGSVASRPSGEIAYSRLLPRSADAAEQREHAGAVADVRRLRVLLLRADDDLGPPVAGRGRRASASRSARRPRAPRNPGVNVTLCDRRVDRRDLGGIDDEHGEARRRACRRRARRTRGGRARPPTISSLPSPSRSPSAGELGEARLGAVELVLRASVVASRTRDRVRATRLAVDDGRREARAARPFTCHTQTLPSRSVTTTSMLAVAVEVGDDGRADA